MPEGWDGPTPLDLELRTRSAISTTDEIARQEGEKREAAACLKSTGEGSDSISSEQSTALTIFSLEWYAICDDTEVIHTAKGNIHVLTLDCIRVDVFWQRLLANANLYDILLNYHNAVSTAEVQNRVALLKAVLQKDGRRFVTIFTAEERFPEFDRLVYPVGRWSCIRIFPKADAKNESMDTVLQTAIEMRDYTVATANLYEDNAQPVTVMFSRLPRLEEEAFLEEIFSLNHVPDAPLADGGTTPPAPVGPAPIVLTDGGFSFEGDADFWRTCTPGPKPEVIDEQTLTPYPEKNKAFCRTTKQIFDVIPGDLEAEEDDYALTLRAQNDKLCFHITVENGALVVEAAVAPTLLEPVDVKPQDTLVLENIATGETYESPRKKAQKKNENRIPLQQIVNANTNQRPMTFSPAKKNPILDKENLKPEDFETIYSTTNKLVLSRNATTGVFVPNRTAKNLLFEFR